MYCKSKVNMSLGFRKNIYIIISLDFNEYPPDHH